MPRHHQSGHPMTVRIWISWRESYVRLTLHDNCPLVLSSGGPTDEGYSHSSEIYEYDAQQGVVTSQIDQDAVDCDGRQTYHSEWIWPVDGPTEPCIDVDSNGNLVELEMQRPVWERLRAHQRDYSAEAAGY